MRKTSSFRNWSKGGALAALLFCGFTQFATARWRPASTGDSIGAAISDPILPPSGSAERSAPAVTPMVPAPATRSNQPATDPAIPPLSSSPIMAPTAPPKGQSPQVRPVRALVTQPVDETALTALAGNTHPYARAEFDQGVAPQDLQLKSMLLVLKRTPEQEADLAQYMQEQLDKSSPNYHAWLTPEQFGQQFGAADSDIQAVTSWLVSHGMQVNQVSKGRTVIEFSGTAAQVQEAFHTEMHKYLLNGEEHWGNASDPQIPSALAPVIHGIASLHNFPRRNYLHRAGEFMREKATGKITEVPAASAPFSGNGGPSPEFTYTKNGNTFYGLGPSDFAKIYNVQALWDAGIDGTGQSIAIVGQTDIQLSDIRTFRSLFGLPAKDPQIITVGTDPGFIQDELEADLDLEWSGAVAKNANIIFVTGGTTATTFGTDLASLYIVENNVAPVVSESYGECEFFLGVAGNLYEKLIMQQAAAEGITFMVSSGDAGTGGCDQGINLIAYDGLAVNGLSSTPYNVSVGGTDFDDVGTQSTYWNPNNAALTQLSAKSYIPEVPWNNSCAQNGLNGCVSAPNGNGNDIIGGAGGPSNCLTTVQGAGGNFFCTGVGNPKPAWQTGPGVPADGVRDTPDVSLMASNRFHGSSYIVCSAHFVAAGSCDINAPFTNFLGVGGTSASSPAFAGIMALVNHKVATMANPTPRQGNANTVLYKLAAQAGASCDSSNPATITNAACIFYDVTKGNNSVACYPNFYPTECSSTTNNVPGVMVDPNNRTTEAWTAGAGYDMATGLGTVNAFNLANNWNSVAFTPSTTTLTLNGGTSAINITHGQSVTVAGAVTPTSATGGVALMSSAATNSGVDGFSLASGGTYSGHTLILPGGTYNVHAHYAGDGNVGASDSGNISVTVAKEVAFTGTYVVPFNLQGQPQGFQGGPESVPYGSVYFLHVIIFNAGQQQCNPMPEGEVQCATGSVTISDGSTAIGTFPLNSNGEAEDQVIQLNAGVHPLSTTYTGDNSYNSSFSATNSLTVTKAVTTSGIVSNVSTAASGTNVMLTANIGTQARVLNASQEPSGTVQFKVNGNNFGAPVTVVGGVASFATGTSVLNTTSLPPGTDNITAVYSGDTNYATSTTPTAAIVTVTGGSLPDLTIAKSHVGTFNQGDANDTYAIVVTNSGAGPTTAAVTVVDTLPALLTETGMAGNGWTCTSVAPFSCTRSDVLAAGSSYPPIYITVSVAATAPASVTNTAVVSGGGETNTANDTANDPTTINAAPTGPNLTMTLTHGGNFTVGTNGTYHFQVSNIGNAPTTSVINVTFTLPTGMGFVSGGGNVVVLGNQLPGPRPGARAGVRAPQSLPTNDGTEVVSCSATGQVATCTFHIGGTFSPTGVLMPGINSFVFPLVVSVGQAAVPNVTMTAVVSDTGDAAPASDGKTANDFTIVAAPVVPDMTITKLHTGNFIQGQTGATYTITASNVGNAPTTGTVTVTDTVPTGLTATAMAGTGWTCTVSPASCTRSDVLTASTAYPPITLTVNVASNAATSVTNMVAVAGGGETNTANDTATDPTTVVVPADMTVISSHSASFSQGQVGATYTLTATNSGSGPTVGAVSVVDTLPASLTATAMSGTGWTCTLATTTCTRSDVLAASASYPPITLTVTVANNAPTSVNNTVTVSGGGEINTSNDSFNDPTTVIQVGPDMTITKSHVGNFNVGQIGATYTITATNSGGASTSGTVTVVDTLPASLTATNMAGTGWTCVLGTLTCTRADVLAGGVSYPAITLTVNVAANAPASVINSAVVSGGGETTTTNDTATDPTTITAPDMTITKSHVGVSPGNSFLQGQNGATYAITATNSGNGPTVGTVTVVDTLPASMTATNMAGTGWACTLGTLTCTRADVLAPAGSYPAITVTVNVAANAPTSVTNTAAVSGGGELNTANDTVNDPTNIIVVAPDMAIAKSHTGNFVVGQVGAAYTITASNIGNGPTVGTVTVVDALPASLTATSVAGTGWTCTLGTLTCTRSDVLAAAGVYPVITLTVTVASNAPSSVTNSVTVSGGGETNVSNDSATDPTTITAPDMTITKSHTGNFTLGQVGATYTITATNSGTASTTAAVSVVDTLPASLTATAMAGTGWTCTLGTLTCTRSDLLANGSAYPVITLTVNVAANAPSSVTNTATVSGGGEVNTANDVASDPTGISAPDLTITKTHTGNFAQGQIGATYTIIASNVGTGSTNGTVTVVDTLPASLSATAMTGTGWTCAVATVSCTRSDALANGAAYPAITLTVTVAANAPASVTNSVVVSGGGEVNLANDSANDPTTITSASASLSTNALVFTAQDVSVASAAKPITITNNGTGALSFSVGPAITGTNSGDFSAGAGTTCVAGTPVPPAGGTCTYNAVFTPGAAGARGQATLTFTDNASPATTQTVTLNGTSIDFAPATPPAPNTVPAGQPAMYTITVNPGTGGFPNPITFSAMGAPAATTVTFTPPSVTPGNSPATTTMTVTTTMRGGGGLPTRNGNRQPQTPYTFNLLCTLVSAMLLFMLAKMRKTRRGTRLKPALCVAVVLIAAVGIAGCAQTPTGTPAGTSTITVSETSGSLTHTTTVSLTVQ